MDNCGGIRGQDPPRWMGDTPFLHTRQYPFTRVGLDLRNCAFCARLGPRLPGATCFRTCNHAALLRAPDFQAGRLYCRGRVRDLEGRFSGLQDHRQRCYCFQSHRRSHGLLGHHRRHRVDRRPPLRAARHRHPLHRHVRLRRILVPQQHPLAARRPALPPRHIARQRAGAEGAPGLAAPCRGRGRGRLVDGRGAVLALGRPVPRRRPLDRAAVRVGQDVAAQLDLPRGRQAEPARGSQVRGRGLRQGRRVPRGRDEGVRHRVRELRRQPGVVPQAALDRDRDREPGVVHQRCDRAPVQEQGRQRLAAAAAFVADERRLGGGFGGGGAEEDQGKVSDHALRHGHVLPARGLLHRGSLHRRQVASAVRPHRQRVGPHGRQRVLARRHGVDFGEGEGVPVRGRCSREPVAGCVSLAGGGSSTARMGGVCTFFAQRELWSDA